jgi:diguanylate cyclase (GGDEF)-like protein
MSETFNQTSCGPPDTDKLASVVFCLTAKPDTDEPDKARASVSGPLHGSLTGIGGRDHLDRCIERALLDCSSGGNVTLILVDLDHLGASNNGGFGHKFGEAVLSLVAGRLQHAAKDADVIARLGRDGFAILVRNSDAEQVVGDLDAVLGEAFVINGQVAKVRPRFGIAQATGPGVTAADLMRRADLALYSAKHAERQSWRFFEPSMARRARARQSADAEMRSALDRGEFRLVYQPQLSCATRRVAGLEALLRWHHPQRGIVPPVEFIPRAEEVGAIVPIGAWVLNTACKAAVGWQGAPRVAVNVSPRQFHDPGQLFAAVKRALSASGLPPERLEIEITESLSLRKDDAVLETLHRLRGLGITIAIDDFGTGHSSLTQLNDFPFDRIKIDRSFVSTLTENSLAVAVVGAIARLGASVGMTTTAEGVETQEQALIVQSNGCTEMQGYLFSRPISGEEVAALLAAFCRTSYSGHLGPGSVAKRSPAGCSPPVSFGSPIGVP